MDSKRRYKTCIWFGRPRATWVFSKLQGLRYYFPQSFRCNFKFYRNENFSDSPLHRIFESDNFRFPFSRKNSLTWGLKCEIKLITKSYREFIRSATKIVQKWNGHLEIFSLLQAIENVSQFLLLRTDILQKKVAGLPLAPLRHQKKGYLTCYAKD